LQRPLSFLFLSQILAALRDRAPPRGQPAPVMGFWFPEPPALKVFEMGHDGNTNPRPRHFTVNHLKFQEKHES
jgi:hypothetical protein